MRRQHGPAKAGHYVLAGLIVVLGAALAAQSTSPATVWQGVYTQAQAGRGQSEYARHCANCHRDDLSGYNDILKGHRFLEKYRESSLHLLFEKTKTTMPRGAAGSLSDQAYVDIVAYLLRMNEFPVGSDELTAGLLPKIQVVGKTGPEPVPDFALVQVVGCLASQPDGAWMLTNTTEPLRTGNPQPTDAERQTAEALPLGDRTFRLLISAAYNPDLHKSHKVEVRGFLIRRPTEHRINISSLETVSSTCGG